MQASIIVAAVAVSAVAHADPQEAQIVSRGGFLLPALQLSASTDDQAKFTASLPYKLPIDSTLQFVTSARLQISSAKGVSTLFSSGGDETLPWEAGLTLLVIEPEEVDRAQVESRAGTAAIHAYDVCVKECKSSDKCDFKTDASEIQKREVLHKNLCPNGEEQYLREEAAIAGLRSLPQSRVSLGASVGRQQFKFLTGPFGAGDPLTQSSSIETSVHAGALYARAWPLTHTHAGVIEVRGIYTRAFHAASATGHWCQPEGMVGSDPNSGVQQCKDLALGAPSDVSTFTLAADIGIADSFKQTWRASVGMFGTTGIATTADSFGIETPVYLNFTPNSAVADYLGSYKGILRITPRLSWSRDASNHFPTTAVLTIEALSQNSIFSEALDY